MGRAVVVLALFAGCGFSTRVPAGDGGGDGEVARDWAYKRKLTIDNTGIPTELTSFAIGIHLDATRIDYAKTKANGADLRIGDASGAVFPYEIETWNPAGKSIVWARVPSIPANAKSDIFLYYGNSDAADAQAAASVWDSDYVGVWHMGDGKDATGRNASTNMGGVAEAGRVGNALRFGAGTHVDTMNTEYLARWTVEVWMNPTLSGTSANGAGAVVSKLPNYTILWSCLSAVFCKSVLFTSTVTHTASYDVGVGTWQHIVGRYDGVALRSYIAGIQGDEELTSATPGTTSLSTKIGLHPDGSGPFTGLIDEVRISRVPRSLDFLRAHVRSTSDLYVTYGPEETN